MHKGGELAIPFVGGCGDTRDGSRLKSWNCISVYHTHRLIAYLNLKAASSTERI
jgi:hypothetical protein